MSENLTQQVAVVTGGSKGIGKAIASALCEQGMTVILIARNKEQLTQAVNSMASLAGQAIALPCDITDEASVIAVFNDVNNNYGGVSLLVNNAGIGFGKPIKDMDLATWQSIVDVNLTAAFLCCREAFKQMEAKGGGRIINIGSIAAIAPRPGAGAYSASKAALEGLTTTLSLEGRDKNIAACIVHPGNTYTDIWAGKEELLKVEPVMDADNVAQHVLHIAKLPLSVNILNSVMFPTTQRLVGRG